MSADPVSSYSSVSTAVHSTESSLSLIVSVTWRVGVDWTDPDDGWAGDPGIVKCVSLSPGKKKISVGPPPPAGAEVSSNDGEK